jgi:hypothetical protein
MKIYFKYLAAMAAVLSTTLVFANTELSTIKIESTSSNILFKNVSFDQRDNALVVKGRLKKLIHDSRVSSGHVDYAIYDSNGKVVDEGAVKYTPSLNNRSWKFGSSFSFEIPDSLPSSAIIKITYHSNQGEVRVVSPPALHVKNLLVQ